MITVKVNFEDGDSFVTRIIASEDEAKAYYIGRVFNLGSVNDHLVHCVSIEIL